MYFEEQHSETAFVAGNVKRAMAAIGASSSDLWKVPIDQFHVLPDWNLRVQDAAWTEGIKDLAASIKNEGFYQSKPISVFVGEGDKLFIADGHRRYFAAKMARDSGLELAFLPAVPLPRGTSRDDVAFELIATATAKILLPHENAYGIKRLVKMGYEPAQVADRLNRPLSEIEERLDFTAMPKPVQDMVFSGAVSYDFSLKLYKKFGSKTEAKLKEMLDAKDAKGSKSKRILPKDEPGFALKKAQQKHAPEIFSLLQRLQDDPAFAKLPQDLQDEATKLSQLIRNADTRRQGAANAEVVSLAKAA